MEAAREMARWAQAKRIRLDDPDLTLLMRFSWHFFLPGRNQIDLEQFAEASVSRNVDDLWGNEMPN